MEQPKVIFLDAVGTLFGVKGSVGEIYGNLAEKFGVSADRVALNRAFFQQFKAAESMAFPEAEPLEVPGLEYQWWRAIAQGTFEAVGALDQFQDFEGYFADLYSYFAGAEPWEIYSDVYDALERWKSLGITLGVISNFDSRLYSVLEALSLADFFQSVTISTEVGAAKPDPLIFATALQKHGCQAAEAWHVGDSYEDDYEGARTAGMQGIWLKRPQGGLG